MTADLGTYFDYETARDQTPRLRARVSEGVPWLGDARLGRSTSRNSSGWLCRGWGAPWSQPPLQGYFPKMSRRFSALESTHEVGHVSHVFGVCSPTFLPLFRFPFTDQSDLDLNSNMLFVL